jgi:hypothetical protein
LERDDWLEECLVRCEVWVTLPLGQIRGFAIIAGQGKGGYNSSMRGWSRSWPILRDGWLEVINWWWICPDRIIVDDDSVSSKVMKTCVKSFKCKGPGRLVSQGGLLRKDYHRQLHKMLCMSILDLCKTLALKPFDCRDPLLEDEKKGPVGEHPLI